MPLPSRPTDADVAADAAQNRRPSADRFLAVVELLGDEMIFDGPRSLVHERLGLKVTLGVLACRMYWRDDVFWREVPAPYVMRARVAAEVEDVLRRKLPTNFSGNDERTRLS